MTLVFYVFVKKKKKEMFCLKFTHLERKYFSYLQNAFLSINITRYALTFKLSVQFMRHAFYL